MIRKRDIDPRAFAEWSDCVEKWLRRGIWLLVLLLLLFQSALQSPAVRAWMSPTDRLEGISYRGPDDSSKSEVKH
ncbi:hypothetical protein GE107_11400 [Cohnella sp. CFH 77786]|uniref:hypothetical protein n=1 Tax=Cohnella sp. CFH 77786 TaxID=2662265 RepID=UPI001C60E751|nr:hypothetical protein [Cohnella sp. CFH 77786]MBW5446666.1 hypothetical protein [Cohnella sp. CFH 77786]